MSWPLRAAPTTGPSNSTGFGSAKNPNTTNPSTHPPNNTTHETSGRICPAWYVYFPSRWNLGGLQYHHNGVCVERVLELAITGEGSRWINSAYWSYAVFFLLRMCVVISKRIWTDGGFLGLVSREQREVELSVHPASPQHQR